MAALATFHANSIKDLDRMPESHFWVQLPPPKGYCRTVHREQVLMSSPAFAIPPDLTRDTGAWPGDGPIKFGSDEHKRLFCKTLLDTHDPYKPAVLDWPKLGEEAEKRITALPIWDIAVQTENRAGLNVCTYAEGCRIRCCARRSRLNGFEERRHRHVLANLVEAYGIKLAPEPVYEKPKDPEWAFMVTGYSECIDSFFRLRPVRGGQGYAAIFRRNWSRPSIRS